MNNENLEQQELEQQSSQAGQPEKPYVPRPKYQLILAWIMLAIVVVGVVLWLLEIATAGKLFGLLG